jgi:hypothetical protein
LCGTGSYPAERPTEAENAVAIEVLARRLFEEVDFLAPGAERREWNGAV